MILKLILRNLSMTKQAKFMKRRGIVLGTRNKNGRQGYLYMLNNLFVEIFYENDNPRQNPESLIVLQGLDNLNRYLTQDLRS